MECRGETHRIQEMDGGAITPLDCTWEQVRADQVVAALRPFAKPPVCCATHIAVMIVSKMFTTGGKLALEDNLHMMPCKRCPGKNPVVCRAHNKACRYLLANAGRSKLDDSDAIMGLCTDPGKAEAVEHELRVRKVSLLEYLKRKGKV